jgi:hypothetical protein
MSETDMTSELQELLHDGVVLDVSIIFFFFLLLFFLLFFFEVDILRLDFLQAFLSMAVCSCKVETFFVSPENDDTARDIQSCLEVVGGLPPKVGHAVQPRCQGEAKEDAEQGRHHQDSDPGALELLRPKRISPHRSDDNRKHLEEATQEPQEHSDGVVLVQSKENQANGVGCKTQGQDVLDSVRLLEELGSYG